MLLFIYKYTFSLFRCKETFSAYKYDETFSVSKEHYFSAHRIDDMYDNEHKMYNIKNYGHCIVLHCKQVYSVVVSGEVNNSHEQQYHLWQVSQ